MPYRTTIEKLTAYRQEIAGLRDKMRKLQAEIEPEPVSDYELATLDGRVRLSQLFGDKKDLFLIHNMGTSCPGCTMWADGFNGLYQHLKTRGAFIVTSPDAPQVQKGFAAARGWRFPMVSHQGTSFAADLGYQRDGRFWPGISVLKRKGAQVLRVADTGFEPGDDFCATYHILALLPEGRADWWPKVAYDDEAPAAACCKG
jgi:predicted dithiol-disulfide oxidoreductase (DUF899 family)